jgi:hypothetical protein
MGESRDDLLQTGWQNTSSGQIFPHTFARALERFTTSAAPRIFPDLIIEMKPGMSIPAGHACVQGASKQ